MTISPICLHELFLRKLLFCLSIHTTQNKIQKHVRSNKIPKFLMTDLLKLGILIPKIYLFIF